MISSRIRSRRFIKNKFDFLGATEISESVFFGVKQTSKAALISVHAKIGAGIKLHPLNPDFWIWGKAGKGVVSLLIFLKTMMVMDLFLCF
jgi:hypothetical protein